MIIKNLSIQEFDTQRLQPDSLVIDVRESWEYEAGHVPGAISLPLSTLSTAEIPIAPVLVFYCQAGYRSKIAAEFVAMRAQMGLLSGIEELSHLKPGYLSWLSEHPK